MDMGSRRIVGFALGEHHDAALAYGALAMAVAVRGGAVPGVVLHTDQGSEYTARSFRAGVPAARHRPVDGPARLGAGQRGHRVLALDAGVRTPVAAAVRHQGGGRDSGRRMDRGLQPRPPAFRARRCAAPWITSGCWRERTPRDRGGPAARAGKGGGCAAAGLAAPAKGTGPPPGLKGASHRAAGDGPSGRPGPRGPLRPLGSRKSGQATGLPRPDAGTTRTARAGQNHHNRSLHA